MITIPGFPNYLISQSGKVYGPNGILKLREFKGTTYARLYLNGRRYVVSVDKLVFELFYNNTNLKIKLNENEYAIRYKDTNYYITNHCRCYNLKTKTFLKPIFRNGYASYNLSVKGQVTIVHPLKFINKYIASIAR